MMTFAVVLGVVCLALGRPGRIDAMPSLAGHEMSGTVQRIDGQTLWIVLTGSSKAESFIWNAKDTKFFRDGAPTTFEALRGGTYVRIHCSHPFFGPGPVLYRVSWQTGASRKK
jgi:hypothetical protein